MKSLLVRFINVAVIAAAIVGYNGILTNREKTDEIAKLDAQLESEKLARKNAEEQAVQGKTEDTQAGTETSDESEGAYKDGTYEGEAGGESMPEARYLTVFFVFLKGFLHLSFSFLPTPPLLMLLPPH